jgi:hypothetical protein
MRVRVVEFNRREMVNLTGACTLNPKSLKRQIDQSSYCQMKKASTCVEAFFMLPDLR